jgi:hypothetical protein
VKIAVTIASVVLAIGGASWAFISYERAEALQFETTAEASPGTVTEKWQNFVVSRPGPTSSRHIAAYRFKTATGAVVDGTDEIDAATWDRIRRGDDIRVYYLPGAPRINHLRLQAAALSWNWRHFVVVFCVGSLFAILITLLWRRV